MDGCSLPPCDCAAPGCAAALAAIKAARRQQRAPLLARHAPATCRLTTHSHCHPPTLPARYNLSLGIGLAEVKGKVFRIGHLGNMDELMLSSALCGAEMALLDAGVPITPGSGVARAVEYWQKTARVIPTREGLVS